ncbi:MAG: hypothetical protein AAGA88_09425 [Pseudomonadota bacterium]
MKKEIRTHTIRMTGTFVLLLALAAWQLDFVIVSINANIYLNATIIGVFLFGVFLAYRGVLGLRTELQAFDALKEEFNDTRVDVTADEGDPNWRYNRCKKPAIMFTRPLILGQSYSLCSDEIGRTGDLQLTAGTMSTLVEGIDIRLDEQRSLLNYVVGILVMLGLIGTFVGLMGTLASVGEIIGGLDLSGGAGPEVIQNLMTSLQKPLEGMATGFSSSLFGLITSLTLGLMTRFNSQALNVVRMSFETWLGGVAQIEGDQTGKPTEDGDGSGAGIGLEGNEKRLMFRTARNVVVNSTKVATATEVLAAHIADLRVEQKSNREAMASIAQHVAVLTETQDRFAVSVNQVAQTLSTQSDIVSTLRSMSDAFQDHRARVDVSLNETSRLVQQTMKANEAVARRMADVSDLVSRQEGVPARLKGIETYLSERFRATSTDLQDQYSRIESIEQTVVPHLRSEESRERAELLAKLDQLIAVSRISDGDAQALKDLARLYRAQGLSESEIAEHFDLPDVPQEPTAAVPEEPVNPSVGSTGTPNEDQLDETFGLFDPAPDADAAKTG